MAKPQGTVELRVFVPPEIRNQIKSVAAAKGLTITEYFLQLHDSQKHKQTA